MTPKRMTRKAVNSSMPVHGLFLLCLLLIGLAGCGAKDFASVRSGIEARGHYIEGVPFFRQTGNDCGPAALASVLSFHGRPADLNAITAAIYLPQLGGALPMDLERYARDAGFRTDASSGSLDSIRQILLSNRPVICLLDLGFGLYRQPHYVIITGFDDTNTLLIMHDGERPDRTMGYDRFDKAWKRAGNWMIVVTP